jgi:outer membrane protein OmpA-like peptidoglycan-associated protein
MKAFIYLILFVPFSGLAQNLSLSVMPRYSMGLAIPPSYKLIQGAEFLTTEIKQSYTGKITASDLSSENEIVERNEGYGADLYLKWGNPQKGVAWGLLMGGYLQKYFYVYYVPTFRLKGRNISEYHIYERRMGISLATRAIFWNNRKLNFFAQLGVCYNVKAQYNNDYLVWKDLKSNYTVRDYENGNGVEFQISGIRTPSFNIVPEIGIRNRGNWGGELSISYAYPIVSSYKEKISFYQNYRIAGVQQADRTASIFALNLKLFVKFERFKKKSSKPKEQTGYVSPKKEEVRYQSVCIRVLDETTRKPIANAQLSMNNNIYTSDNDGNIPLSQLICCNERAVKVTATNYKEASKTFILSYQTDCQNIEVLLAKNEIIKPKFDNKEVVVGKSMVLNIQFEQSNKTLLPSAKIELEKVVELLKNNPTAIITLAGHTSNEGDYNLNVKLSRERAEACKNYLIERVPNAQNRVEAKGFGSTRPLLPNTSDENRKKNRRVELVVEHF